ncbi:MAG: alpha/beta hydrolase [Chloroflexi bacterium]|nr:alpha/beta hydrolase [Chloroflexota bacterium]
MRRARAGRGLGYEEVWLTASDGVRLHGWFVPGPRDLVWLWLHGNGGNISHRVENIAFIQRRLGASVFIFDYRGYGLSEGRPSEDGLYRDADAALAYLRIRPDLDARRVVLFGRSLGTAVAVDLAARERVLGLILESPLTSIPGLARALYPFLPLEPLLRTRYDALAKIGRVAAPLLVIHSRDDEVIPYQQGQALFAAAREPKRLYTLTGARHNDTYLRGGDGYWQALDGFLASLQSR